MNEGDSDGNTLLATDGTKEGRFDGSRVGTSDGIGEGFSLIIGDGFNDILKLGGLLGKFVGTELNEGFPLDKNDGMSLGLVDFNSLGR